MKFNAGAAVHAADGKTLGHLSQVVLNPHTKEVTDIVVHKGYFFTTDKVIPVKDIQQTLEDRVSLHATAAIAGYPDFIDTTFIPLVDRDAAGELPSPLLWYPPFQMMVYNPIVSDSTYVVHETTNIPLGSEALVIGSEVITLDDKRVGHLQEVFMNSATNQSSHILVSKGIFLPGEKLVPTSWIKDVDADVKEIHLSVSADMMMSLARL